MCCANPKDVCRRRVDEKAEGNWLAERRGRMAAGFGKRWGGGVDADELRYLEVTSLLIRRLEVLEIPLLTSLH